jgi:integrase
LLREHLSADPVRALLTKKGNPWVTTSLRDDGMLGRADNISVNFNKVKTATGIRKPLKIFRKTSATRLMAEPRYRDLRHYFLGHSAKNMADKHYAKESAALLAEAVQWLGRQYGLVG